MKTYVLLEVMEERVFIFDWTLRGPLVLFSVILSEHSLRMESREQNSERLWEHSRKKQD